MDEKIITLKIQALLHDPPEKPIILGRIGHEGRARELMTELGLKFEAQIPDAVRKADQIASAADRINLPKDEGFVADFLMDPNIKHPLSARSFDLKSLHDLDIAAVNEMVSQTFTSLYEGYAGNKEKIYLALWRQLLELLKNKNEDKASLGKLWELLPADTRIPDHSIWDHKRVTAAIAGSLPKPAFLLFSIGPVQEFIATARKTQDLWAGSYILSYLSWTAIKVIAEALGPDSLIFPDLCGQPFADLWLIKEKGLFMDEPGPEKLTSPTLPNRFWAAVPEQVAIDLAKKAEAAVTDTFRQICKVVQGGMEKDLDISPEAWDSIWNRQTADFIEAYWSCTPAYDYREFLDNYRELMGLDGTWGFNLLLEEYERTGFIPNTGTVYGQIYRFTEKAMGSRKTVRDFSYTEEFNYKCTLCGLREPLHPGQYKGNSCIEDFGALRGFWEESVRQRILSIRKAERLCAVCSTKRLAAHYFFKGFLNYNIGTLFPSLSMVATSSFRQRILENMSKPELEIWVREFTGHMEELFKGKMELLQGAPLPMVRRMCRSEDMKNGELAERFARIEGDWLMEESVRESIKDVKDELPNYSEELCRTALEALNKLIKSAKTQKLSEPGKYYAVLLMDGDNMGKWLSGEHSPLIGDVLHPVVKNALDSDNAWTSLKKMKRPLSPSIHLAISKALRDFSLKVVREVVERDHLGKLVYAGGDDVLAFVNLSHLAKVMRKLRAFFSGHLIEEENTGRVEIDFTGGRGFIPVDEQDLPINPESSGKKIEGFLLSMGDLATASMGVVIAHHNSNLAKVLEMVRIAEKKAKKMPDKNGWSVVLSKRSGGTEDFTAKWYYRAETGQVFETIPLLDGWATAFAQDRVSPRFVYQYREETRGMMGGLPEEAILLEMKRLASRHCPDKAFRENELPCLVKGLAFLVKRTSVEEVGKFLSLTAFLGREVNR